MFFIWQHGKKALLKFQLDYVDSYHESIDCILGSCYSKICHIYRCYGYMVKNKLEDYN